MKEESYGYKFYKLSLLLLLLFLSAINYNLFINPIKIVAGGANGLSVALQELFGFDPAIIILVISVMILLFALLFKQYELVIGALLASISYPIFVEITAPLNGIININTSDYLIVAVFSGIISGIVSGITCKIGTSQGGTVLISQTLNNIFGISIARSNTVINLFIVLFGSVVFGASNILLAIIFLFTSRLIMDKVILGISQNKLFQIITKEDKAIIEYITNNLNSGVTTFKIKGGFELNKKTVVMTSISNIDYFRLKEGIHDIDKSAFVVVTDSYQVKGGK